MTPVPLEIIETKILKPFKYPRIVHNGYLYHFHKKCNHHLRWKCNRVYSCKCPAVLRTNMDMLGLQCIAVDHEHAHGKDSVAIEQLKLKIRVHQTSTLFKKNACFKPRDENDEEIHLPENILNNKLARFCASMNQIFFINPLDSDSEYGNKCEEVIKTNNSEDTSFNFENCSCNILKQEIDENQIKIENSNNSITNNHTNYSSLNNCIQNDQGRPPKEQNMIVSEKKENVTQNNESTLLTNTLNETNILTTNTHNEINNLTTNIRKVKNSLINKRKKGKNLLISNMYKIKNTLRNKKNRYKCIMTKNNHKKKISLISGMKKDKNRSTANTNTLKKSLTTNAYKKKNIMMTHKQKNKNTLITNVRRKIISSKVKKYTSKFKNQNSNTITNTPIIISTSTTLTSPIKSIPTIESVPTILTTKIISTPKIENTPTITNTPINISTPTIISTPKIESTPTVINLPTIISTPTVTSTPIIENTPSIISTSTIESTPTIVSIPTIISKPTIVSRPTVITLPTIISKPTVTSTPIIESTSTIERCMNKSINYEDDIISISDDDDNDSDFDFVEVNDDYDEINNINLKDDDMKILMDCKDDWPTILNKMSDPLTGIKVFESILFNKLLIRMMRGNNRTKKKIHLLKRRTDHWKTKFECLSHKIKTLINSTRSDKNIKLNSIQNKNVKDTTLCSNIGIDKQANYVGVIKKVSTELKSNITPNSLKTSKLYQKSLNSKNKYLSESDVDTMSSKSEEIKTNISSTPVVVDLIKDIPSDLASSRISPKLFYTKQNNLTQSDSDINITQSKVNESNELFTPVSNTTKALELSPKSLKRKISNLIQNNTSIEIIKPKFVKCSESSSLAFIDSTIDSIPDMMASRLSPKLLNSQIKNFTHHNTAIEIPESNVTEYESSTSASIDITVNNLPAIKNSRLSSEKNIFTEYSNDTEIIPPISISTDLSSNIPTFSSSSMSAITPVNNSLIHKSVTLPLCTEPLSNIEILMIDKNSNISTMNLKRMNCKEWMSPRKLTIYPKTGSSVKSIILPFAIKRLSKSNKHLPLQSPMLNRLLTNSNTTIQLDKRDILNTSIIPVQNKTSLPDVVYESTQLMNTVNCKETN